MCSLQRCIYFQSFIPDLSYKVKKLKKNYLYFSFVGGGSVESSVPYLHQLVGGRLEDIGGLFFCQLWFESVQLPFLQLVPHLVLVFHHHTWFLLAIDGSFGTN